MDAATVALPVAAKDNSTVEAEPRAALASAELRTADPGVAAATKPTTVQFVMMVLAPVAFLYFARPVILPVCLACVAGMTLKPLIRWLTYCHIPPSLSAAPVIEIGRAAGRG